MVTQEQKGEGTALFSRLSTQELPNMRVNVWRSKCSTLENYRASKPFKSLFRELGRKSGRKGVFHSSKEKGSRWFSGNQLVTSETHWSWESRNCSDRGHKNHLWTIRNSHHFLSLCSINKYSRTKKNEALDQPWQWRAPMKLKYGIGKDWRNQHDDFLRKHLWAEQSLPTKPKLLLPCCGRHHLPEEVFLKEPQEEKLLTH